MKRLILVVVSLLILGTVGDARAKSNAFAPDREIIDRIKEQAQSAEERRIESENLKEALKPNELGNLLEGVEEERIAKEKVSKLKEVGELIDALKTADSDVRKEAVKALVSLGWKPTNDENGAWFWLAKEDWDKVVGIGSGSVPPLIAVLEGKMRLLWLDRQKAAKALGAIKDPHAVKSLIEALQDKNWSSWLADATPASPLHSANSFNNKKAALRISVAEALVQIGKPSVESLIEVLNNEDSSVREKVAWALGEIKDLHAFEPLIETLNKDKNWSVRRQAAMALESLECNELKNGRHDLRTFEHLILALKKDDDSSVREKVAWALGALTRCARESGVDVAVTTGTPLIAALTDKSSAVSEAAVEALGSSNGLTDEDSARFWLIKKDLDKVVAVGSGSVVPLIEVLKDKNRWGHEKAAEALVTIGKPSVEPLIGVLNDDDWSVRKAAVKALAELKDPSAVAPLIEVMSKDNNSGIRESAAWALGELGDPRAVRPLITALQDKQVDTAAAEALVKQTGNVLLYLVRQWWVWSFLLFFVLVVRSLLILGSKRLFHSR